MYQYADLFSGHTFFFFAARNFLNRALVGQTVETMISILDTYRCASGFSVNLGSLEDLSVVNIEVSPTGYQKTCVNGYSYHFNA